MPWQAIAFFLLFTVLALQSGVRSLSQLAPGVSLQQVIVRGVFAGRRFYTQVGWRYRNRAIAFQVLGVLGAVAIWYGTRAW